MPAFFIISGITLSLPPKEDAPKWFYNKFKRFFLPFFIFAIIEGILRDELGIKYWLKMLYGGRIVTGVYWYIPCLYIGLFFFYCINTRISSMTKRKVFLGLLYFLSIIESKLIIPQGTNDYPMYLNFPLNMDVVLLIVVYISIGFYYKKSFGTIKNFNNKKTIFLYLGTVIFYSIFIILDYYNIYTFDLDMKYSHYSNLLLVMVLPLIALVFIFRISAYISEHKYLGYIMSVIGKHSMLIMYIHIIIKDCFLIKGDYEQYSLTFYVGISLCVSIMVGLFCEQIKKHKIV